MKNLKPEYKTRTLSDYELSNFLRDLRKDGLEVRDTYKRCEDLISFARDFLISLLKKNKIVTDEMIYIYKKSLRIANEMSGCNVTISGEEFGIGNYYPNENTGGMLGFKKTINEAVRIRQSFDFSWRQATQEKSEEETFILPPVRDDWNIKAEDIKDEKDREILKKLLIEISRCRYIMKNYLSHLCNKNNPYTFLKNRIKSPVTWGKLLKFDENLFNEYLRLNGYKEDRVFISETSSTEEKSRVEKKLEEQPRVILNKLRETLEK